LSDTFYIYWFSTFVEMLLQNIQQALNCQARKMAFIGKSAQLADRSRSNARAASA
jgi:hypothetical protein